ncbi:MAG: hypothetical protein FWC39_13060 [Bacteroidetes bacterium]|nr:hypothetical protein [Bacteroidota bacterium]
MKRLYFFIIPLLLQSCSSMYIPPVSSIPLLEKKGEFQGEAGASTNSIYANAAYAFTDHIAASVSGNLSYKNFSNQYDIFSIILPPLLSSSKFAHRYAEASVGAVNVLRSETSGKPILEIFGGMGRGRATDNESICNWYRCDNTDCACDYYSFFAQGNFGVKECFGIKQPIFETGLSMRLAYSLFNYVANKNDDFLFQTNFGAFHIEPMGFVRVGGEKLKFVYRQGLNLAFTKKDPTGEHYSFRGFNETNIGKLRYTIFHFSIGASYRIGEKTDKSKK